MSTLVNSEGCLGCVVTLQRTEVMWLRAVTRGIRETQYTHYSPQYGVKGEK